VNDKDRKARNFIRDQGEMARTARDFKDALGIGKSLRMRQAEVVSLSKTTETATVKIGGGTQVAGVRYFSCLPCPGYSVWCMTDGEDIWITHSQGPAPTARLNHTGTQNHTSSGNEQNVDFQDPMDANGVPQNGGWDFWNLWNSGQSARLPVPAPGMYTVNGNLSFAANNTGRRYALIKRVDTSNEVAREDEHTLTNTIVSMTLNQLVKVPDATGVEFALVAFQNSGGNLGYITSGGSTFYSPMLSWTWMGPYGA
jgi:hypothetical protein